MNSNHELHLTYLTVRARGEPIILLLAGAGVPFTLEEIPPTTWGQRRKAGKISRDQYPYSLLPVLRVKDKSGVKEDFVLAETSAILAFLEEFLAPRDEPLLRDMSLEVRTRAQMIKEASLFFLAQCWQTSIDKDWLAPPKRDKLWRGLVTRYLRNTEGALLDLQKSTNVVPSATDSLKGHTVAVATAIEFITNLFPSAKEFLTEGGQYELCGKVWGAVHERGKVVDYWTRNNVRAKPWTITKYGTAEWIAQEAAQEAANAGAKL